MKLIFSLGNPESSYDGTRHNVGFIVADALAAKQNASFAPKPKFKALIAEYVASEKIIIAKPTTYYNQVGESYRAICDFYKIEPEDTLIIHDELSLPFGTLRARAGGNDAGNNGIKSINQHGGITSARLRIGVANKSRALIGDVDFVLGKFSKDELATLTDKKLPIALDLVDSFTNGTHQNTSHKLTDTVA